MRDGDLATIRQPLDFYGVNYYAPQRVAAAPEDAPMPFEFLELLGHPTTDAGVPVVPEALREWLIMLRARFRAALPPIVITENGASYGTGPDAEGVVDDRDRIEFHRAHLEAVETAIRRGVDVRGYYAWSLLDNFEWSKGLSHRFGLVHVDFETQVRTPKRSFEWYAEVIAAQAKHAGLSRRAGRLRPGPRPAAPPTRVSRSRAGRDVQPGVPGQPRVVVAARREPHAVGQRPGRGVVVAVGAQVQPGEVRRGERPLPRLRQGAARAGSASSVRWPSSRATRAACQSSQSRQAARAAIIPSGE